MKHYPAEDRPPVRAATPSQSDAAVAEFLGRADFGELVLRCLSEGAALAREENRRIAEPPPTMRRKTGA